MYRSYGRNSNTFSPNKQKKIYPTFHVRKLYSNISQCWIGLELKCGRNFWMAP